MQSKGQVAAKVIGIILVLALLAGLIAVIYKFTNGFNEDFKTFYVEHDGKQFLSAQNDLVLEDAGVHRFDVKYTFDTEQSETKDYAVEIVPNAEQDFEYLVDGEPHLFSRAGDLSAAFDLNKQATYFEITTTDGMTLQSILERCHAGQTVEVPADAEKGNAYPFQLIVTSYNGSVSYRIALSVGMTVTGITLDPPSIVFTG